MSPLQAASPAELEPGLAAPADGTCRPGFLCRLASRAPPHPHVPHRPSKSPGVPPKASPPAGPLTWPRGTFVVSRELLAETLAFETRGPCFLCWALGCSSWAMSGLGRGPHVAGDTGRAGGPVRAGRPRPVSEAPVTRSPGFSSPAWKPALPVTVPGPLPRIHLQ